MWKFLRRSSLFLLTAVAGLLAGVLIRFWAGSGLAWKIAPAAPGPGAAATGPSGAEWSAPADTGAETGSGADQASRNHSLMRLRAIAEQDFDALCADLLRETEDAMLGDYGDMKTINSLMRLDPARTLTWMKQHDLGSIVWQTWRDWQKKDAAAAEAWAKANDPDLLRRLALEPPRAVPKEELARLMKEDPAALERLLVTPGIHRAGYLEKVLQLKLGESPAAALAWAGGLTRAADRSSTMLNALKEWTKTDPKAAAEAWKKLPQGKAKSAALEEIARALPPDDAVAWLKTEGSSPLVQRAMAEALGKVTDPAKRAEMLKLLTHPASGEPDKEALARYARARQEQARQSGSAAEMIAAMEEGLKLGAGPGHMDDAYRKDPAATLAAIDRLPELSRRDALAMIGISLSNRPESDIQATLSSLPKGELRDATAASFAAALSGSSPERAAQLLLAQEPSHFRTLALPDVLEKYYQRDAGKAAALWNSLPAEEQAAAGPKFAQSLARAPDQQRMALLTTIPGVPPETIVSATQNWLGTAPDEASAWVNTLPAGPARDGSARAIAASLVMGDWDPDRAVTWAASIGDVAMRQATLRSTVSLWTMRDPAAAAAAVANLPPADQAALQTETSDISLAPSSP